MSISQQPTSSSTTGMNRFLRPDQFEVDPSTPAADLRWAHWRLTFKNFLSAEASDTISETTKLNLLINHLAPTIYSFIRECKDYVTALNLLDKIYLKSKNEIHARHVASTRKQKPDETISEYMRSLQQLAYDCNFKAVTAEQYRSEFIRDAFISGISSQKIRQRLLENLSLDLEEAYNQAVSLEMAEKNSQAFHSHPSFQLNLVETNSSQVNDRLPPTSDKNLATTNSKKRCFFCGGNVHQRIKCPAFRAICQICAKKGHFANVCRSGKPTVNAITELSTISAASPSCLRKSTISVTVNDTRADALIDSGSSNSFIDNKFAELINLKRKSWQEAVTLASKKHISLVKGMCYATIKMNQHTYEQKPLLIMDDMCADIIIGHDILQYHSSVEIKFGGDKEPLIICNVIKASVPPASVFTNLTSDCKPIAIKSKKHNETDNQFIKEEIENLLKDEVIEPSVSPWRAQVLVTGGITHRKRLVIDYSLTINKFTQLDAFPLPNIESIVSKVAKYNYFSQIDLKSAYHQVPILQKEKIYTAFEACGNLYQFTRIPFGVTNGVAAFQRTLQYIITKESLVGTFAYLDDVTVCGHSKIDHDENLKKFMEAVRKYNLTLNEKKCTFGANSINLLGYTIENNVIKPDKDRLSPLTNLPIPKDLASLRRALGMFAHYSKWIKDFSEKISPLSRAVSFPLDKNAIASFEALKLDIANASLTAIHEDEIFTVETDASEHSIAASLSQNGRPVAFFSRTLNDSERGHATIEKEANAIVEALRKWRHYLIGRHFLLITDQQSVAFMFNQCHSSKIKNEKIERWRLELSNYKYDIIYRPGKENVTADTLSRVCSSLVTRDKLYELHNQLGHPGIVRMTHWVRAKNLPYSVEDVKSVIATCPICAEIKSRFLKTKSHLIKATAPFERLNIDFKGPIPTNTQNKYILTIIDEYSRFPFAYPCKDLTAGTVIKCLKDLFFTFGIPLYIHSDRGTSFMSQELKDYLISLGVACSRTTPYNPQGNGQVERLNGTLWRTILLCLCARNLSTSCWEQVLNTALHSIRSLLCTSTNTTPHERMFKHPRRSVYGESLPTWLMKPGPVLMKKNVRNSKYDPLVEEVDLLEANPSYSYIRLPDGRETTVSNRQLAPRPCNLDLELPGDKNEVVEEEYFEDAICESQSELEPESVVDNTQRNYSSELRRSTREKRTPTYLRDYLQ